MRINFKFYRLNEASKTRIILPRILVICIVFGVVDMLLWPINTKTVFRHFFKTISISMVQVRIVGVVIASKTFQLT